LSLKRILIHHGRATRDRMPISPLDAYEDHFPVGYVAFYRKTLDPTLLIRALVEVLAHYPLLSGRMVRERGIKKIALDDAGVGFDIDETNETLADWREPDRNAIGRFVRLILPQLTLRSREPLMNVRLTQLAGGGSVLGVSFGHVLADGTAIAGFLRDWAKAARGEAIEAPVWDRREQARAIDANGFDPAHVPVHASSYLGMHEASVRELGRLYAHLLGTLALWKGYTIALRGEDIETLKSETNAGHSELLSSNDVLGAFLWKLFNRKLEPYGDFRSRFFGVVDLRRHTPGVPARGVFGNMPGHLAIESTTRETADLDLHALARKLRRASQAIAPHHFLAQETWLGHRQIEGRMYRVLAAEPYPGDVTVSNCRYMPFYDIDFGEGRPYFFNLPAEKFPRVVIWPAADGDGCVLDVNLTPRMARELVPTLTRKRPLALDFDHGR
jgi:shikimate O-hydroxycinnamoyltransferase